VTEYDGSEYSSLTVSNNQVKMNAVSVSSASDNLNNHGHSENESDHNRTLDDIPKLEDTESCSEHVSSDDDDDEDYEKKSSGKKNGTSSSKNFSL